MILEIEYFEIFIELVMVKSNFFRSCFEFNTFLHLHSLHPNYQLQVFVVYTHCQVLRNFHLDHIQFQYGTQENCRLPITVQMDSKMEYYNSQEFYQHHRLQHLHIQIIPFQQVHLYSFLLLLSEFYQQQLFDIFELFQLSLIYHQLIQLFLSILSKLHL